MPTGFRAHLAFHLTGARTGAEPTAGHALRPALLAGYTDPTALRGDFPVVLVHGAPDGCVQSLSRLIDDLLARLAPRGSDGELMRRTVLRCEQEMRALAAGGGRHTLSSLWNLAVRRLGADEAATAELRRARAGLTVDGDVTACDEHLPARLLEHAWRAVQLDKARRFHAEVGRLIIQLSDIVRADFLASAAGRTPEQLRASFGDARGDTFDFEAMSRMLTRRTAETAGAGRVKRIRWALSVLEHQPFFPTPGGNGPHPHQFVFDGCGAALAAYHERLPEVVRVAKALAIGRLEVDGLYVEARHERFFEQFSVAALRPADLARFPDYLVRLDSAAAPAREGARLLEALASGLPIKVLVQSHDLLEQPGNGHHLPFGVPVNRLGATAMGLDEVFVLQTPSSHLYCMREQLVRGLTRPGAALFSVFAGSHRHIPHLPPQVVAAAALESRAFPAFTWDPWAGPELSDRMSIDGNPQPDRDWPGYALEYEDTEQQRRTEELAFTYADFAACDARNAGELALVPPESWNDDLVPLAAWLAGPGGDHRVPSLSLVDGDDRLQRAIASDRLVQATRRCAAAWNHLQVLARPRVVEVVQAPTPAPEPEPVAAPAPAATEAPAATAAPGGDDPYIETPRCSTCNECTNVNPRMFAYNADKQATIANLDAGTYAHLVQAAENCQLSIIHPGKPRNPDEPDLPALIERAQPFL